MFTALVDPSESVTLVYKFSYWKWVMLTLLDTGIAFMTCSIWQVLWKWPQGKLLHTVKKWESLKLLMTILLTLALQPSALRSEGWSFFGGSWWLQKFLRQPNATSTSSLKPHHQFTTNQFPKVTKRESSNVHAARTPRRVNELLSHVLSTIPHIYNQVSPLLIPLERTFTRSLCLFCSFSTRILST